MLRASSNRSRGTSTKWKPKADKESRKLASSCEWSFAGSTSPSGTRSTRQTSSRNRAPDDVSEDQSNDENDSVISDTSGTPVVVMATSESTMSTITHETPVSKSAKPSNSRVILEVGALQNIFGRHLKDCPECESDLKITLPSCCIATANQA